MTVIIIISITVYAVVTVVYFQFSELTLFNRNINSLLTAEEQLITSIIERIEDEALGLALSIADREDVKNAYKNSNEDQVIINLKKTISPLIATLKTGLEYDEFKIHFHKPPAISLLRTWHETRNEDLSGYRNSILHVYNSGEPVKCIEMGRAGPAIRGIAPIFDGTKYLGSIEVLFGIQDVISFTKKNNPDLDFFVIANKDSMNKFLFEEDKQKYYIDVWNRHIVIAKTLPDDNTLEKDLIEQLDKGVEKGLRIFKTDISTIANLNINDFSGKIIGHFLFLFNKSAAVKNINKLVTFFTLMNFTIGILIIILFLIYFRRIQHQLLKYNNQLQAEIEQKNRFFSIIAHDLRSPFSALIGFSRILINDDVSDEQKNKFTEAIHESSLKGLYLLENLLHWASSQTGELKIELEKINLRSATSEAEQLIKLSLLQKKISFVSDIPDDLFVYTDQNCLKTILRNLISNSTKFTAAGGTITVKAERQQELIAFTISDTGVGMTEEQLKNLFSFADKISTNGTEDEHGAGIGLIIVKDFIEKCGGRITVKSRKGIGTTFTFTLPEYTGQNSDK